jgi:hypothetical protein
MKRYVGGNDGSLAAARGPHALRNAVSSIPAVSLDVVRFRPTADIRSPLKRTLL